MTRNDLILKAAFALALALAHDDVGYGARSRIIRFAALALMNGDESAEDTLSVLAYQTAKALPCGARGIAHVLFRVVGNQQFRDIAVADTMLEESIVTFHRVYGG